MVIGGADGVAVQSEAGPSVLKAERHSAGRCRVSCGFVHPKLYQQSGVFSYEFREFLEVSCSHCIFFLE